MKEIVCIVCPNSCKLSIDEQSLVVTGAKCKRGEAFAKAELTLPMRTVTTTVKTAFAAMPVLPVKTNGEVPKARMRELLSVVRGVVVTERLSLGDVVMANVLGTGVDLVATASILDKG